MKTASARLALVFFVALMGLCSTVTAWAEIKTKEITYQDGNVTLKGLMAWDGAKNGRRPGILVVDEWWGLTAYAKNLASQLAAAGYVAFAADMYGDGKITNDPNQAKKWMQGVIGDTGLWNRRAQLGLDILKSDANVDGGKLAAVGSSFGGATALQMAYAGHDVKAVVSIASALFPAPDSVTAIKPRVLVFHGNDDSAVPAKRIEAFKAGLDRARADWEMIIYSGTRHSFANPDANSRGIENLAYNEMAAKRSWIAMTTLFDEVFK